MATGLKNLSNYSDAEIPDASDMKFGIVVAQWNNDITNALCSGVVLTLKKHNAKDKNIIIKAVPGSFELTLGGQWFAEYTDVDAIICIGCVIRGDTPHFDYICQSATQGITNLNMKYDKPFIFCALTTDTLEQAQDRAGGKHGNKGDEAAITAIMMVALKKDFISNYEKRI